MTLHGLNSLPFENFFIQSLFAARIIVCTQTAVSFVQKHVNIFENMTSLFCEFVQLYANRLSGIRYWEYFPTLGIRNILVSCKSGNYRCIFSRSWFTSVEDQDISIPFKHRIESFDFRRNIAVHSKPSSNTRTNIHCLPLNSCEDECWFDIGITLRISAWILKSCLSIGY